MTPTFNEWSAAKELLTFLAKLVSLQPKTNLFLESEEETMMIAAEVFKRPFGSSSERFPHAVRLLPTLQVAQSKIAHWIAILSSEEEQTNDTKSPQHEMRAPLSKQPTRSTESQQLSTKAEKLVKEVRTAIQTLSTSSFLGDPKPTPLRAALTKLKPMVDEFVEALSKSSLDSQQKGSFTPFKHQANFAKLPQEKNDSRIPISIFQESAKVPEKAAVRIHVAKTSKGDSIEDPKIKENASLSNAKSTSLYKMEPLKTPDDLPHTSKERGDSVAEKKSEPSLLLKHPRNRSLLLKREEKQMPAPTDPPSSTSTKKEITENTRVPVTTALRPNFQELLADLDRNPKAFSSALDSTQEETGWLPQKRLPVSISLPHLVSNLNQRPLEAAKKKKQTRYFFKDEEPEDDSSFPRD